MGESNTEADDDARVDGNWRVDAHVHLFPEEAATDPAAWGAARCESHWAALVTLGPQGWASTREMLRCMDAAGVEAVFLMGWYWENLDTCEEQNQFLAACRNEAPDRIFPFASTQPSAGAAALEVVKRAADVGFVGIGELMHTVQRFHPTGPAFDAMAQWAIENDWPVCFHVTEPVGHAYPGRVDTPLEDFVALGERHPDLRMLLAHWGGGLAFHALNPRVKRALRNAWFDTAASPLLYDMRVFSAIGTVVPEDKVLFGSDYPLRLFPRTQPVPEMKRFVDAAGAKIGAASVRQKVFRQNALDLLPRSRDGQPTKP